MRIVEGDKGFILKGIERGLGLDFFMSIMITFTFHPQRNWKRNARTPGRGPRQGFILKGIERLIDSLDCLCAGKPCFILKGIESWIFSSFDTNLFRHVSSSKELKDSLISSAYHNSVGFILKGIESLKRVSAVTPSSLFHPQRNWKIWENSRSCAGMTVSSSKELKVDWGFPYPSSSCLFHPQRNWKKNELFTKPIGDIEKFHPQRNWKFPVPVVSPLSS